MEGTFLELTGQSFLAGKRISSGTNVFHGKYATTGEFLQPAFTSASAQDVDTAVVAAASAFPAFAKTSPSVRAALLRSIATHLEKSARELVARAMAETALPQARLEGEVGRTCGQLRPLRDNRRRRLMAGRAHRSRFAPTVSLCHALICAPC